MASEMSYVRMPERGFITATAFRAEVGGTAKTRYSAV